MESWFFKPAEEMIASGNDVAAVHLVTPLIEALEIRYRGMQSNNQSGKFFKDRAKEIFQLDDVALGILYGGVRCGFAYYGFVKSEGGIYNILITSGLAKPLVHTPPMLFIDAPKYVAAIRSAFKQYCDLAETDNEAKQKFMSLWDGDWPMSLRVTDAFGT